MSKSSTETDIKWRISYWRNRNIDRIFLKVCFYNYTHSSFEKKISSLRVWLYFIVWTHMLLTTCFSISNAYTNKRAMQIVFLEFWMALRESLFYANCRANRLWVFALRIGTHKIVEDFAKDKIYFVPEKHVILYCINYAFKSSKELLKSR